jgi:parallel beta-helix repeat protein
MVRFNVARFTGALVIAVLLVGGMVGPVSAGTTERWVDDDASPGDGPAACDSAAFSSIQAAIDASNDWDHVNVCPGTYEEQLTLDVRGILVQSVRLRKAHIVAPALMTEEDGLITLVRMTEWAARLYGFRLDIAAGEAPSFENVIPTCSPVDVAVLALGERSRVRWNKIDATGDATFSGNCGYSYGIVFTDQVLPPEFGAPYPIETSRATHNTVRDFKFGGILAEGARKVRIDHNSVRYLHADDPGCGSIFNATPEAQLVCDINLVAPTEVNSAFPLAFGIGVEDGALADIQANTVRSTFTQTTPSIIAGISPLYEGIHLTGADGDSRVRGNNVYGVHQAIVIGSGISLPPVVPNLVTSGVEIKNNNVHTSQVGISLESGDDANDVHDNRSHGNDAGIVVHSSDNQIYDNDFRFNEEIDCFDNTSGSGTADTANWWTDNLGNINTPSGICTADAP